MKQPATFDRELLIEAADILDLCRDGGRMLATVESCTGGLLAAVLTAIPGSSHVVEAGLVTYSNAAKHRLADVPEDLIAAHGAVSEQVARAMAEGARERLNVDIAVSVTGVAGPDGGTEAKPVGLVHFACAARERPTLHRRRLYGAESRDAIRRLSVLDALDLVREQIGSGGMVA
ncbi:MAG: CinA family protein [Parvibaculaceae bacterium]